ncbi:MULTISPECIES: DUF1330 domain-containing protein [Streptomyces]|uniref:DUF1330 domain-containing protein n=2 Tax=Streptomyces TaxID=1883 RepID=D7BSZ6_STRBB|nr:MULTISPECIES: DUF1330 domain-containing protein [Streptomyces]ADI05211.1 hypothetical protein SBI_02090 [Streptomyces bingchenggensis BCW-1]
MSKGYWVVAYRSISDPAKSAAYVKLAVPVVEKAKGRFLTLGGQVVAHEAGVAERTVVIEFDSFELAVATHDSEDYQKALTVLGDGADRDFRIVEGAD